MLESKQTLNHPKYTGSHAALSAGGCALPRTTASISCAEISLLNCVVCTRSQNRRQLSPLLWLSSSHWKGGGGAHLSRTFSPPSRMYVFIYVNSLLLPVCHDGKPLRCCNANPNNPTLRFDGRDRPSSRAWRKPILQHLYMCLCMYTHLVVLCRRSTISNESVDRLMILSLSSALRHAFFLVGNR